MSSQQWKSTLSLALEIPFESKEDQIWEKLLKKQSKYGEIFLTTLTMIDIVRLPFINYSFIKWFYKSGTYSNPELNKKFQLIQNDFNVHLKKRIQSELLGLIESDKNELKENLTKFHQKLLELEGKYNKKDIIEAILTFLDTLETEIKELEEKKEETASDIEES